MAFPVSPPDPPLPFRNVSEAMTNGIIPTYSMQLMKVAVLLLTTGPKSEPISKVKMLKSAAEINIFNALFWSP